MPDQQSEAEAIDQGWKKIKSWVESRAPEELEYLSELASEESIVFLKNEFDREIPVALISSLKQHNGIDRGVPFYSMCMNSCSDIVSAQRNITEPPKAIGSDATFLNIYPWLKDPKKARLHWEKTYKKQWEETTNKILKAGKHYLLDEQPTGTDSGIRPCIWNLRWIQVGSNEYTVWCVDLDPIEDGTIGQIVELDIEEGTRKIIAKSFLELFTVQVEKITSNEKKA